DEHGISPRNADQVAEEAAPWPAKRLQAVHGAERDALAATGEPSAAAGAASAADLERDNDPLPGGNRGDVAANLDDLSDPLVTKRKRARERRGSVDNCGVEVAGCDSARPDQSILVVGQFGWPDVAPLDLAVPGEEQLLHWVLSLPLRSHRAHLLASSASASGVTMILDVGRGDYSITIRSFSRPAPS